MAYSRIDGFEAAFTGTTGGGAGNAFTNATITTGAKLDDGAYGMDLNSTAAVARQQLTVSTQITVARFLLRFPVALPSGLSTIFVAETAGTYGELWLDNTDGKLYAVLGADTGTKHPTALTTGVTYIIDVRMNMSANPNTIDFAVDGVAATQLTGAIAAQTITTLDIGNNAAVDFRAYVDALGLSVTAGDYPLQHVGVIRQVSIADGTHNAGTNVVERQDGVDIGTATAFSLVDEIPVETTDYIRQVATGSGNYFETTLTQITQTNIKGLAGYVLFRSSATTANSASTYVREGSTDRAIYSGDMSPGTGTTECRAAVISLSSYTRENINALRFRGGYATSVASQPRWLLVLTQVAYGKPLAPPPFPRRTQYQYRRIR